MHPVTALEDGPASAAAWGQHHALFARAILIRRVEQQLLTLFSEGKLHGTVHTCIGQEWTGIAVCDFLRPGDFVFSNHRCHGHFLSRTDDVEGLIAEVMGRQSGVCGGRGGSQHLCRDGFFSNGIQGGIVPVAAGPALSHQLRGTDGLAVAFIGDGTLGEGVVYETLNAAAKWNLPLLIVLENNGYAQSTDTSTTIAGNICDRARAFDISTVRASTWDPEHLLEETERCIEGIRNGEGPAFLCIDTYRLMAHSKGDDDRCPDEVAEYQERDPVNRYSLAWPDEAANAADEAQQRIDKAVALAELSPSAQLPSQLTFTSSAGAAAQTYSEWEPLEPGSGERCVSVVRDALERALTSDPDVFLLGEDIESPYGGAFKVTQGLSDRFPNRVSNTPISEALIVGMGNGLALAGMIPVCEIMFGDFLLLAADQIINHASKFREMYNDQVRVPIIVRTPMGGRRGYGPTHSQSLEKHFFGVPGVTVLALNHRQDPGRLYDHLFESIDGPVLMIENKTLYGQRLPREFPAGFAFEQTGGRFPTLRIRPEGPPDVTVVCYGEMLRHVEDAVLRAFDDEEIIGEVVCPTCVSPLDLNAILESVLRTGRLLVVEEGIGVAGFGAEVIARVAAASGQQALQLQCLGAPVFSIPANADLENELLPNSDAILEQLKVMMAHG